MQPLSATTDSPLLPRQFNNFLSGELLISAGENEFLEQRCVVAPFKEGLTVAVALGGSMTCRINDRETILVEAPSVSLILNSSQHQREQVFRGGQRFRYALVHLSPKVVESHIGIPFHSLLDMVKQLDGGHDPSFISRPADLVIKSIASQIMICPIQGSSRSLFLIGKGLELAACAIEQCSPAPSPQYYSIPLASQDIERIMAARDILLTKFAKPLSLKNLAISVGMNSRVLNVGFRQLFGLTLSDFLQEHRLQMAYQMIASGQMNISQAAYNVGYTPTYFSTLFRRRFGVSPKELQT